MLLHSNRSFVFGLALLFTAGLAEPLKAQNPTLHVDWINDPGGPREHRDFEITDGEFPEVQLIAARTDWLVWSTNGDDPGDIGRIWTDQPGAFGVTVADPFGGPGARNLNDIDLRPSINQVTSVKSGSYITGDLGSAFVKRSDALFVMTVGGDVTGRVESQGDMCLWVMGSVVQGAVIHAQQLSGGCGGQIGRVYVEENLAGTIEIVGDIQGGFYQGQGSFIQIGNEEPGTGNVLPGGAISFQRLHYTQNVLYQPEVWITGDCGGTILFDQIDRGEDGACSLIIEGELTSTGKIGGKYPYGNRFAGTITVDDACAGEIELGWLTQGWPPVPGTLNLPDVFSGRLMLGTVDANVSLVTLADGALIAGNGQGGGVGVVLEDYSISVTEDFQGGAEIKIDKLWGDLNITQQEDTAGGDITVLKEMSGDIDIDGDYEGDITIAIPTGMPSGTKIAISGKLADDGDIEIDGDANGRINIGGRLSGDVSVGGDLTGSNAVNVGGALYGRVLIGGLCDGVIDVAKNLNTGALIRAVEGLGEDGKVLINTSEGDNDAEGTIHFGNADLTIQDDVVYDGCVRVYDNGSGYYGNLSGSLIVNGCHDPANTLNICIDGTYTGSSIQILESGCQYQIPTPKFACGGCE